MSAPNTADQHRRDLLDEPTRARLASKHAEALARLNGDDQ